MRQTLGAAITAVVTGAPSTIEGGDGSSSPDPEQPEPEPDPQDPDRQDPKPTPDPEDPEPLPDDSDTYDPAGKSLVELLADIDRLVAESEQATVDGDTELAAQRLRESKAATAEARKLLEGQ